MIPDDESFNEVLGYVLYQFGWPFSGDIVGTDDRPWVPPALSIRVCAEHYQVGDAVPGRDLTSIEEYHLMFEDELGVSLPRA